MDSSRKLLGNFKEEPEPDHPQEQFELMDIKKPKILMKHHDPTFTQMRDQQPQRVKEQPYDGMGSQKSDRSGSA